MTSRDLDFEHVFEPGEATTPAYTALLLHGTGADQHDLLPIGRMLAPGHPLLSPLGKVRENGMPRWFARVREGVFDEEDLRRRAEGLAAFLEDAESAYELNPGRYVAIGFSNGANIAGALLLLHPGALRGAVLMRPMTPLVPDELPDLSGVPIYIAAGRQDPLVPTEDVERLAGLLEEAGASVTLVWSPGGHGLTRDELGPIRGWLQRHEEALSRGSPP